MENEKLKAVRELLANEKTAAALKLFNETEPEDTVDYWLLKGKLEQKFQNWSSALNAFFKVLDLDENNREAKNNIHLIQNILNFWNPEMFNP